MKKQCVILALLLVFCMVFSMGILPASAEVEETYDTFDELTLSDLGLNPGTFENEISQGGHTYSAKSTSNSAVIKFEWKIGTLTDKGWMLTFDKDYNTNAGVWFRSDYIYFGFGNSDIAGTFSPITEGTYSVEFGRKFVKDGINKDKYYVYISIDGDLIAGGYTSEYTKNSYNSGNGMQNKIFINGEELSAQRFSDAGVEPENYDTCDELTLSDLEINHGNFTNVISPGGYTYTAKSSSHSVAVKFQWKVGALTGEGWTISLDGEYRCDKAGIWFRNDGIYFCYLNEDLKQEARYLPPITEGTHIVEFGRKLVTSGANAGMYYVYFLVDGVILGSGYTAQYMNSDYNDENGMQDIVYIRANDLAAQRFADVGPEKETYEYCDEIGFDDLSIDSISVAGRTLTGTHTYTYNCTSSTHSVIFRYRYTVGTSMGIQFSLDTANGNISWPFGVWVKNPNDNGAGTFGAWHLNAEIDETLADMTVAVSQNDIFDIELGRLKVKTGENTGKYYVYLNVNGEKISSYYYDGVDANGTYNNTTQLSNKIIIVDPNNTQGTFSAIPKPIPEKIKGDLNGDGYANAIDLTLLKNILLGIKSSDEVNADFNGDSAVDILDIIAMKKYLVSKVSDLRWYIAETKRMIETTNMEGHSEKLEMSGEQVSGFVNYGVQNGNLSLTMDIVFPSFRIQPNNTGGSYIVYGIKSPALFGNEKFDKAQISGILTFYSHTDKASIKRCFYPSTTLPCFYEDVEIIATTDDVTPVFEGIKRLQTKLGCEGYIYVDRVADQTSVTVKKGDTFHVIFAYSARFANENIPTETDALQKRMARVEELLNECDLTTGNDVIDTEFAFAKIRAGESLFRTENGLVHCPGGYSYYAAVWCNDQLEYASPWFAYTGDAKAMEATENAFRWYEPYMNDEYKAIPSSIIAEGNDYWNSSGDRGDAAMYLYGLSRYLLTTGKEPDAGQQRALEWCVEYISRKTLDDGAVYSDTDELEGRLSSGVNLSTTSLAYGGLELVAQIWQKYGKYDLVQKATDLRTHIGQAFEGHFAADLKGYKTYAYHQGCTDIRAWNCLPVYMGVMDRAEDTLQSIYDKLWNDDSCRTTEGEDVMWDRSALYYMASMFRADNTEKAFSMLEGYSMRRLLGERVPYPVEAYPEGNMRHLSAESALYCRVITDGLLNIVSNGDTYSYRENIPFISGEITLKNVYINGEYRDIVIR